MTSNSLGTEKIELRLVPGMIIQVGDVHFGDGFRVFDQFPVDNDTTFLNLLLVCGAGGLNFCQHFTIIAVPRDYNELYVCVFHHERGRVGWVRARSFTNSNTRIL